MDSRRPGLSTGDSGLANKEPMFRRFVTGDISVDARTIAQNRVVEAKLPGLKTTTGSASTRAADRIVSGRPGSRNWVGTIEPARSVSFLSREQVFGKSET